MSRLATGSTPTFGPEAAAAIRLAADLGNFLTLQPHSPFSNHGEVEIRAIRTGTPPEKGPDPEGDCLTFHLRIGDSESRLTTKIDFLEESGFRFRHLLGPTDVLLEGKLLLLPLFTARSALFTPRISP